MLLPKPVTEIKNRGDVEKSLELNSWTKKEKKLAEGGKNWWRRKEWNAEKNRLLAGAPERTRLEGRKR